MPRLLIPGLPVAIVLLATLVILGCTSEEVQQLEAAREGASLSPEAFSVETSLCRKVSRKSGRRIGVGQEFKITKKSYVRAFVDFENVKTDRPYTVHLVWIRPDGKELFRKYAEVRLAETPKGDFRTVVDWLSAEDLHAVKSDTLLSPEPGFTLETRFNISEKKERVPGEYYFRVYLDRRLFWEKSFLVVGPLEVAIPDSLG
jgi:hypothetical protein